MTATAAASATVELLTAEVRTLMIGNRQITLSIYKQLDTVKREAIAPFGRVRTGEKRRDGFGDDVPYVEVVGRIRDRYRGAGALARARLATQRQYPTLRRANYSEQEWGQRMAEHSAREEARLAVVAAWSALPLIVLAGLR